VKQSFDSTLFLYLVSELAEQQHCDETSMCLHFSVQFVAFDTLLDAVKDSEQFLLFYQLG
jgi:hypothetical protein